MQALLPISGLGLLTCFLAVLLGWLVMRIGPKDHPDGGRKSQSTAMPTSGGIAVFLSVIPFSLFAVLNEPGFFSIPVLVAMAGSLYMFIMGLWDDLTDLSASLKLVAQIVLAVGVAALGVRVEFFDLGRHYFELGAILGIAGSAAWLVVVTNAVNFMDGADGLAMGSSATLSAGLAGLAALTGHYDIAALSGIMFAGLLGLLYWNGRGKLFAGDTGALFVGFYLAALSLIWVARLDASVWIAPCLFIGFLADVLLTLIWRYRNGRSLMPPHREHVYQLMIAGGTSHVLTAWVYIWITLHGILVAGVSLVFPRGGAMLGFLLLLAILFWLSRRIRRSVIENGFLVP